MNKIFEMVKVLVGCNEDEMELGPRLIFFHNVQIIYFGKTILLLQNIRKQFPVVQGDAIKCLVMSDQQSNMFSIQYKTKTSRTFLQL